MNEKKLVNFTGCLQILSTKYGKEILIELFIIAEKS